MGKIQINGEYATHYSTFSDYNYVDEDYTVDKSKILECRESNCVKDMHIYANYDKNDTLYNHKNAFLKANVNVDSVYCGNFTCYSKFKFNNYLFIFETHLYVYDSRFLTAKNFITENNIKYGLLYILRSNTAEIIRCKADDFVVNTYALEVDNIIIDNKNNINSFNGNVDISSLKFVNGSNWVSTTYSKGANYALSQMQIFSGYDFNINYYNTREFTIDISYLYNYTDGSGGPIHRPHFKVIETAYTGIIPNMYGNMLKISSIPMGTNANTIFTFTVGASIINRSKDFINTNSTPVFDTINIRCKDINGVWYDIDQISSKSTITSYTNNIRIYSSFKKYDDKYKTLVSKTEYDKYIIVLNTLSNDTDFRLYSANIENSTDPQTKIFVKKYCVLFYKSDCFINHEAQIVRYNFDQDTMTSLDYSANVIFNTLLFYR